MRKLKLVLEYAIVFLSMTGFVPGHASLTRVVSFVTIVVVTALLRYYYPDDVTFGAVLFAIGEILYLGSLWLILSKDGLRHWFVRKWKGEEEGYLAFEAVLGILFYVNAAGIAYIASVTPGNLSGLISREMMVILAAVMTATGLIIKMWAAKVVTIDIYYWKDMFLGRKVCEFVVTGPYKFLKNPMYGIGQLTAYAFAIWCGSWIGLIAAFLNQMLVFAFYYTAERKFIKRVYLGIPD